MTRGPWLRSPRGPRGQHDAGQINRILRAQLLHNVGTMDFDGPLADAKRFRRLLAGVGGHDMAQDLALALREAVAARKRPQCSGVAVERESCLDSLSAVDHFAHARNYTLDAPGFFEEIIGTAPDGFDCGRMAPFAETMRIGAG
jgi:hypothetical protein